MFNGAVGRADLLRLLAADRYSAREAAELTGFKPPRPATPVAEAPTPTPDQPSRRQSSPSPGDVEERPDEILLSPLPVPFLQPRRIEFRQPHPGIAEDVQPLRRAELGYIPKPDPSVPSRHLDTARSLLRRWRNLLNSRRIDEHALVDCMARLQPVERIPYRRRRVSERSVRLFLERDPRVWPLVDDQNRLALQFERALGQRNVSCDGFSGPAQMAVVAERQAFAEDRGRLTLIVTALGSLPRSGGAASGSWREAATAIVRSGARCRAIVPADLRPAPRMAGWPIERWGRVAVLPEAVDRLASQLLDLTAPAIQVSPGLLRRLSRLLLGPHDSPAVELAAWNHPDRAGGNPAVLELAEQVRGKRLDRFRRLEPDLQRRALGLIREWMSGDPKETRLLWELELQAAGLPHDASRSDEAEAFLQRMLLNLRPQAEDGSQLKPPLRSFALALERSGSALLWNSTAREELGLAARLAEPDREDETYRGDVDPARLAALQGAVEEPREVELFFGDTLVLTEPKGHTVIQDEVAEKRRGGPPRRGSVARLVMGRPEIQVSEAGQRGSSVQLADGEGVIPLGFDSARRARRRTDSSEEPCPPWAVAAGRDRFGRWCDVEEAGVRFRLRWIPPGRFTMGSPPTEEGRFDDEEQREVAIERGFWLGEAPVTQALWMAVKNGDNPSRFHSPMRPVERVSLEDVRSFADELNRRAAGGQRQSASDSPPATHSQWRLPSEEEWEYACRAFTDTATYAGDLKIVGLNNAPLLDTIAWYGGNSGVDFDLGDGEKATWGAKQFEFEKAGTRIVKTRDPNDFGLYDMLGNVFEWCEAGDEGNGMIRGGSWYSPAGRVRAAYRDHWHRDNRIHYLGFRLARGPALQPGEDAAEPRGEQGEAGAGAGRASEGEAAVAIRLAKTPEVHFRTDYADLRCGPGPSPGVGRGDGPGSVRIVVRGRRIRRRHATTLDPARSVHDGVAADGGRTIRRRGSARGHDRGGVLARRSAGRSAELWMAVAGNDDNPSRFQSPQRPVEQVDLDQARSFLQELNRRAAEFVRQQTGDAGSESVPAVAPTQRRRVGVCVSGLHRYGDVRGGLEDRWREQRSSARQDLLVRRKQRCRFRSRQGRRRQLGGHGVRFQEGWDPDCEDSRSQ